MSAEQKKPGIGNSDISKRRWDHSENQVVRKRARHGRKRIFRGRDKIMEDVSRRDRIQQSWKEFEEKEQLAETQRTMYYDQQLPEHIEESGKVGTVGQVKEEYVSIEAIERSGKLRERSQKDSSVQPSFAAKMIVFLGKTFKVIR